MKTTAQNNDIALLSAEYKYQHDAISLLLMVYKRKNKLVPAIIHVFLNMLRACSTALVFKLTYVPEETATCMFCREVIHHVMYAKSPHFDIALC